ncbi:MAG TPA: hypothetical protein VFG34_02510 [Sphingopyxis sp.]|nr:hypothetical protein [Sphingopyxis sp.]
MMRSSPCDLKPLLLVPAFLTALAACSKQPSFDERYEKASAEIDARVKALDAAVMEAEATDKGVNGANGAQRAKGEADAKAPPIKFSLPVQGMLAKEAGSSGE